MLTGCLLTYAFVVWFRFSRSATGCTQKLRQADVKEFSCLTYFAFGKPSVDVLYGKRFPA